MPEGKKNVGSPGYGGPMVTAGGLVFIGATRDKRFRAFDSKTGKELWTMQLDYNVTAVPMTYQVLARRLRPGPAVRRPARAHRSAEIP